MDDPGKPSKNNDIDSIKFNPAFFHRLSKNRGARSENAATKASIDTN